jgi:DnaJ like chaperone protein
MTYWGKILGGMAGFAMGGPVGAIFGVAMGHAADEGVVTNMAERIGTAMPFESARIAAMLGRRDQLFAIAATVLAAKLAKCDGPVGRNEIDAFKASFRIPEGSVSEIARLFDNARDSPEGFESYADQLGQAFADNRAVLEQVLAGLYQIARADGPLNNAEADFLEQVAGGFGLALDAAQRAGRGQPAQAPSEDPYKVLGVPRRATDEQIRTRWKELMRETHPDSLASRGETPAAIAAASDRVARINAAYDVIKRDRLL